MANDDINGVLSQRTTSLKRIVLTILLLAVLAAVFILNKSKGTKKYSSMNMISYSEWDSSGMISYVNYKNGIIKVSRDGAEAIASSGSIIWNVAYNMRNPVAVVCDEYCAVAEVGQKQLCIIAPDGTTNRLTMPYPISDVSVSAQGVAAVLTNAGKEDYIYIFSMESADGTSPLCVIKTVVENSGFPIEVSISTDGRKLATAYMKVDNDDVSNWITFYNFGDVGQNWIDHIVGSYNSGSAFVPEIYMLENNMVVVCRDNGFYAYKVNEVPETKAIEEFENSEIKAVTVNNSYICIVLKNTSGDNRYTYIVYNSDGTRLREFQSGFEFNNIIINSNDIMAYNSDSFIIYSITGKIKYSGTFEKNVDKVFAGSESRRYIVTGSGYIEIVEFAEEK